MLDVKVRSKVALAARTRMAATALGVAAAAVAGISFLWIGGQWALGQLVYENPAFSIKEIDIQTDGVISPEQLRRWSTARTGQNLLALDLSSVKRELEAVPMIQSASVERVLPSTLRVYVTEREPVAQVNVPRPRVHGEGIELLVFELDAEGSVMVPLDPRQRAIPLTQADTRLPVISGLNVTELQPGRKLDSPQLKAALQLILEFDNSPLAGVTDLRRIDVSSTQVLVVTSREGSEITLKPGDFERQLLRWQAVHEECVRQNQSIATLDLAVPQNTPLRIQDATVLPPPPVRNAKPLRNKRKHV